MSGSTMQYPPGDPRMIDTIVHQLKSQGIFDQFRKECIADVDTKPAYQNLHQRVESTVSGFLAHQVWRPDLNKNQLRESLRKHIHESGFLDMGVERIVDQVVNPKINSVLVPQVEDVVYKFIGVEKPKKRLDFLHNPPPSLFSFQFDAPDKKKDVSLTDLLPKDLDPVSPESDGTKKSDLSVEDGELDEDKACDDEASPPFENIAEANDNSVGSHLSGISGLTSPDGRHSSISFVGDRTSLITMPIESNNDSQLSKVSSGSQLSISFDEVEKTTQPTSDVHPMDMDLIDAMIPERDTIQDRSAMSFEESDSSKSSMELPEMVDAARSESVTFSDDSSCSAPEYETRDVYSPLEISPDEHGAMFTQDHKVSKYQEVERPNVEEEETVGVTQKDYVEKLATHEKDDKKVTPKVKEEKEVDKMLVKPDREKVAKIETEAEKLSKKDIATSKDADDVKKDKKDRKVEKDVKVKTEKDEHIKKKEHEGSSSKKTEKGKDSKKYDKTKSEKSVKKDEKDKKTVKNDERDKSVKKDEKDKSDQKEDKELKLIKKDEKVKTDHGNGSHDSKRRESSSHHRPKSDKDKHHSSSKSSRHDDVEKGTKSDKDGSKDDKSKRDEKAKSDDKHRSKNGKLDKDKSSRSDEKHSSKDKDRSGKEKETSSKKSEGVKTEKDKEAKTKSSGDKTKDGKRRDKVKPTDDHDKHREKRSEDRRSTDRDSNGTTRDVAPSSSRAASSGTRDAQRHEAKDEKKEGKKRNGGNNDAAELPRNAATDSARAATPMSPKSPFNKRHAETAGELREEYFCTNEEGKLTLKIKKPKIAANIFEVQKIIQMRKSLAKMEQQRQKELCAVQELMESADEKMQAIPQDSILSVQDLDQLSIIHYSDSDDTEDLKGFEDTSFEDNLNFMACVKRISESKDLCEIDVSSVCTEDMDYQSDSELGPHHKNPDYSNTRLPYPDIGLSPGTIRENKAVDIFNKITNPIDNGATIKSASGNSGNSKRAGVSKSLIPSSSINAKQTMNNLSGRASNPVTQTDSQRSADEMRPPANTVFSSDKRETRRARKPNIRYSSEDYSFEADNDEPDYEPPMKRSAGMLGKATPAKKLKLPIPEAVPSVKVSQLSNSIEVDDGSAAVSISGVREANAKLNGSRTDAGDVTVSAVNHDAVSSPNVTRTGVAKQTLGPSRPVGLSRPKHVMTRVAVLELCRVATPPNPDFVMPLSPESDVSASSGELAKKGAAEVSPTKSEEDVPAVAMNDARRNPRGTAAPPAPKGQRYSSDDLYKPRPLFNRLTRRTRGSSPANSQETTDSAVDQHSEVAPESTPQLSKHQR